MRTWCRVLLIAGAIASVAGCGGGSGSTQVADGGSSGTGISSGPVTSVGSITLNGRTFDTSAAEIRIEGRSGSLAEIEPGHVVRVRADFATDSALRISFDPHIVGPVDAVSMAGGTGTMTVMGQTVIIDDATIVDAALDAGMIAEGDRLRVSGLPGADGALTATRIEPAGAMTDPLERLLGVMHNPGITAGDSLRMGGLIVDHSNASTAAFPGGEPSAGDRIAVTGNLAADGSGVLAAETVEPHVPVEAEAGEFVEITGILEGLAGTDRFAVEGVGLDLSGADVAGGALAAGTRVLVRGELDGDGRLRASEVAVDP